MTTSNYLGVSPYFGDVFKQVFTVNSIMDRFIKTILDVLNIVAIGSFGAIVRLIHTKPSKVSVLMVVSEMITGGFVAFMTFLALSNFSTFSYSVISFWCGISALISREVISIVVKRSTEELKKKLSVKEK